VADFFEVDFLTVGASESGDAITLRYEQDRQAFTRRRAPRVAVVAVFPRKKWLSCGWKAGIA